MKNPRYLVEKDGAFTIENYNHAAPFSNFLPGIAGLFGIPMWVFYVNRGQCIASAGIKSKDFPVMEFLPANRAYQLTSSQGFRTFIKLKTKKRPALYEPFRLHPANGGDSCSQKMRITSHGFSISEEERFFGLKVEARYFTVPTEGFAGLARVLTVKNISRRDIPMEVADGLPIIIPYGTSNFFLQNMRRTIEAWMLVENISKKAPFYRLKVDPHDVSEVRFVEEGNFYLSAGEVDGVPEGLLDIVVDPALIFNHVNDFTYPHAFMLPGEFKVPSRQMGENKLPSAFSFLRTRLRKGREFKIYSIAGHIDSIGTLNNVLSRVASPRFYETKEQENIRIVNDLQDAIFTRSGDRRFDAYCRQTFLDNVLRGGYPLTFGSRPRVFYVYSRKHGDLERDYNRFYLDPTYFSQGNGNYRDVNQNRRNDIFFNPAMKDFNISVFYNLIQPDGFNPLVIKGIRFRLKDGVDLKRLLKGVTSKDRVGDLEDIISAGFTPGSLFMDMQKRGINLRRGWLEFLNTLLEECDAVPEAEHSEGFWIDHWTYNLDLVEAFLSVYPEAFSWILIEKNDFVFFDNTCYVRPRMEKCVLTPSGAVRQYRAIARNARKEHIIRKREELPHAIRTGYGKGRIYTTNLFVKMLSLAVNKMASLDPSGSGIEMEADKPGWCDSMNGLPALFAASTPELFELKRLLRFMLDALDRMPLKKDYRIKLPCEVHDFMVSIHSLIKKESKISPARRDLYYWEHANAVKEAYRKKTRDGFLGREKDMSLSCARPILRDFLAKIERSIKKTYIPSQRLFATYFINEVTAYKKTGKKDPVTELPLVRPVKFKKKRLPLFLEGIARAIKTMDDPEKIREVYRAVKRSPLYDRKLKMYKINALLKGVSKEVGRSAIFTPGWLENESIWLHMEYKYLLEILKAGLYEEFFEEIKTCLVPFMKPEVYGRNIFENSSFIVSSAFADKRLHGKGFVARLSGSTAELIHMWLIMNVGKEPFFINDRGELNLKFNPALPGWLFTKAPSGEFPAHIYAFKFLNKTTVVYHNPSMKNTAGRGAVRVRFMVMKYDSGKKIEIRGGIITSPYARNVRDRKVARIDAYLR